MRFVLAAHWTFIRMYITVSARSIYIGQPRNRQEGCVMIELTFTYMIATGILVVYGAQV